MCSSSLSELKKSTAVDESLSKTSTRCSVLGYTNQLQDQVNRMRNLHHIILQEYGLEALHLFRDWERHWLSASNYKHHRIFTLRCIHKELVPVSIKLKTTKKTNRARKIIKQAERNLLQARVKARNSILDNVSKQTELCRSKLASILSIHRFRECQGFIEKVGEIRFHKVKYRQVNKFNNVLRKEGNITWVSTQFSPCQTGRFPPSWGQHYFPGSQCRPLGKFSFPGRQAGRCSPSQGQHCFPGSQHSF